MVHISGVRSPRTVQSFTNWILKEEGFANELAAVECRLTKFVSPSAERAELPLAAVSCVSPTFDILVLSSVLLSVAAVGSSIVIHLPARTVAIVTKGRGVYSLFVIIAAGKLTVLGAPRNIFP